MWAGRNGVDLRAHVGRRCGRQRQEQHAEHDRSHAPVLRVREPCRHHCSLAGRRAASVPAVVLRALRNAVAIPAPSWSPAPIGCESTLFRSEEHTSELQSLMRISYAVFCLKKQTIHYKKHKTEIK